MYNYPDVYPRVINTRSCYAPGDTMFDFRTTPSTTTRARRGTLTTPHGTVQTPAFVTVGTKATVKGLSPADLEATGTQFVFANTYHLTLSPTPEVVAKHGGVHKLSGIQKPMITDSGGFQVFSLAFNKERPDGEPLPVTKPLATAPLADTSASLDDARASLDDSDLPAQPHLVQITDDGVRFRSHIDGTEYFFTPEFSIDAQIKIGADFIVAFDECIYAGATRKYTERATERTHKWAQRSLDHLQKHGVDEQQKMYGVIQGGMYEDLRKLSTETIAGMDFFGIALGGVSVGEANEELRQQIIWMMDVLHADPRPRHLLGISSFEDVIFGVLHRVDTFDCILPTRDARTGKIYISTTPKAGTLAHKHGLPHYDKVKITDSRFKGSTEPFNEKLLPGVTFGYMHHLFKQKELLYHRYATMHNLSMMEEFFAQIRVAIENGRM